MLISPHHHITVSSGARFVKIGVIRPGAGIEIVLNEATKRKSSAAVGFNNQDERQLGEDAKGLVLPCTQHITISERALNVSNTINMRNMV